MLTELHTHVHAYSHSKKKEKQIAHSHLYILKFPKPDHRNETHISLTCGLTAEGTSKNTTVKKELNYLKGACFSSNILGVAVTLCLCVMTVLLLAVAYRHRWKLRYLFYATRLAYSRKRSRYSMG
jgi:hypothetical protein